MIRINFNDFKYEINDFLYSIKGKTMLNQLDTNKLESYYNIVFDKNEHIRGSSKIAVKMIAELTDKYKK